MSKVTMIGGSGFLGLCLGLVMSGNGVNGQTLALAGLISVPVLGVGLIIGDTKAQSRINYAEGIASEASRRAENLLSHLEASEEREKYLRNELATIQEGFTRAKELLKACESERCESAAAISQLRSTLASATARLEEVEAEIEEWERSFHSKVETEAQKRFESAKNAEIKRIQEENDAITLEAMGITRAYREWAVEVDARLQDKSEFVKSVMSRYNNHLEGLKGSIDTQIEEYLKQIEILNCKVAALQQQLAGDLVAPEYGKFGYQWDARIADDIARHIWQSMHIPLAVKGFKSNPDGSAEAGYAYSRSHPIEALQRDLNRLSGDIAKRLGIHAIESIKKHDLSELLIVTWRCERPKPIAEDAFYRIVAPASACTKLLREALDHKKGGKPTLRIMGATGEGKGIIAKILLADWVKSESGEIWLSDPMDGSDEDRWEVPKAAKSSREARQLLKEFEGEFRRRKDKISARKDVPVLGLFDEFDKEHPRDDKDLVKSIWTAMRHHKMRLILMGQSSEVGSNGWQWDEMKNCACLFVGSGITTAIKHAKDLGLSRAIASQLESQNDQIQNWLESKNQGLDAANQYRVGLLVCSDKAQFIEFPPAHKGAIERDKSVIVSRPWESVVTDEKEVINELKVCPGCGEKLRKSGSRLRCDSPNHTKDMGVKSFKIEV